MSLPSALRLAVLLTLLVPGLPAGAQAPAEDPAALGPWAVGFQAFGLVDPAREDRTLPTALSYPVAAAVIPVANVQRIQNLTVVSFFRAGCGTRSPTTTFSIPPMPSPTSRE